MRYWVMNNILGQFGLGGRLADNIRERQGMAYYAYSALDPSLGVGPLVVRAGVDPDNVERALAAIDDEVRALGGRRADRRGTGADPAVPDRVDSADARNQRRHRLVPADGGAVRPRPRLRSPPADDIRAVTLDEVRAAAAELLAPGARRRRGCRAAARLAMPPLASTRAVFFDVDFTLIYPGPAFQGTAIGTSVRATASRSTPRPSTVPWRPRRRRSRPRATSTIRRSSSGTPAHHRRDGRRGPGVERAARDIYDQWSACHHFEMYEDVPEVLRALARVGREDRPHLEHPALADGVPEPLRARRAVRRRGLVVRPRLHEAAPQHLRSGAASRSPSSRTRR